MDKPDPPDPPARSTWHELEPRVERALRVGMPLAVYVAAMAAGFLTLPFDRAVQWASFMNGYLFLPLGREVTIPLMLSSGFGVPESVGLVVLVDMAAAAFIAWNMDLARRLPYFGGFIRGTEKAATGFRERHPSLRAFGLLGLFLWAVKPGRGSGGATSAILGKLVFVETRWLLPTILAASLIGCTLVALAAQTILEATGVSLGLVGGAVLGAVALYTLYHARREVAGRIHHALRREGPNTSEE